MAYEATFIHYGDEIPYTPSGAAVSAGEVIAQGNLVAVAKADIADGEEGALTLTGVFLVDKTDANTFVAGAPVYWDAADNEATSDADTGTNKLMGYAVEAQAGTDAADQVKVRLSSQVQ